MVSDDSGLLSIAASGNASQDFLGALAGFKVADAVNSLPWNVAKERPEFGLVVGNHFAVFDDPADRFLRLAIASNASHPVDFVSVEGNQQGGGCRRS